MKNAIRILSAASLASLAFSASAAVTASLDRDAVSAGEPVQLMLQRDGRGGGEPDLAPLRKDFDVLGTSSGTSVQIVNGHIAAQKQIQLTLSPKRSGTLQVPPITWDGEQSSALTLTVGGNGGGGAKSGDAAAAAPAHVFVTSTVDRPQPYVQGAVVLTVRVHTDRPLYQAGLDFAGDDDVLVQQIGKDRSFNETRDGRRYDIIERRYLLLPQHSGDVRLEGPVLDAQIAEDRDPFGSTPFGGVFGGSALGRVFGATRPLRAHGDPVELHVRPRPASATGREWLPAKRVELEATTQPETARIRVGEPLTLHLKLHAEGQTATQLPDPATLLTLPDGLKAYPDQAKLDTGGDGDVVTGTREQDVALIASQPGTYRIPAVHLSWWDVEHDAPRETVLPERTLEILPGAGGASADLPAPTASTAPPAAVASAAPDDGRVPIRAPLVTGGGIWRWVSLALGLLWIGTLAAWALHRRSRSVPRAAPSVAPPEHEKKAGDARKSFLRACRDDDAAAARRHLLAWARHAWREENPPVGLQAVADRLPERRSAELVRELDRACYAGGAPWRGCALADALPDLPKISASTGGRSALEPLYAGSARTR